MFSLKDYIKSKFVRERLVPIIIPSFQSNLLQGKNILISGGNSGIGLGIAKKFIEAGGNVIISGTKEDKLKAIADSIKASFLVLDIKNIGEIKSRIEKLSEKVNIDILVNSAGIHGSETFGSVTEEGWNSVLDVNVKGLYFLSQAIAIEMINKKNKGHILNISSASALKPSWSPYEISKKAVNGITLGLADSLIKYGIIVNGLAPGPTATPMLNFNSAEGLDLKWGANPSGRVSTIDEIANWALFLASDLGNGIVGDTLYITGGSGTISINK